MTYTIGQKEPEGWENAVRVSWNGKHVATFRYMDSALSYVETDTVNRRERGNIPACDYRIDMDQN